MARRIDIEDYKRMINSFRVTDLQALIAHFGRNHMGRKTELQIRATDLLVNTPPDISCEKFKQKIRELYKSCREEQQLQLQQNMANSNVRALPLTRPQNAYGIGSNQYQNLPQQGRNNLPGMNTVVYQNGIGNTTTYSYPAMYVQAQVVECNLGNTARILTQSITPSNCNFRKMPFFNVKYEVLKPTVLTLNTPTSLRINGRLSNTHEFTFAFVLTSDMASEIAMYRDITTKKHMVQAQLRMCAVDNTVPNSTKGEYDDFLPLGLVIRVNGAQCNTLPPLTPNSRPGGEQRRVPGPIDITQFLKLSPMNVNQVMINWTQEINKAYVVTLNVVEKLSSSLLLERLKEKPTISIDLTKLIIRKQYRRVIDDGDDNDISMNAEDDDIATTIVRVSLMCPLAKFRMIFPAKGQNCSHLQCFDGSAFISLNEKKSMWVCPVCHKRLSFDDLLIDQYFTDVLKSDELTEDCQEVQLLVDGSWKSYVEEATPDSSSERQNTNSMSTSSPAASPASENDIQIGTSAEVPSNETGNNTVENGSIGADTVVDLTCEEEDEMDEISPAEENVAATAATVQENDEICSYSSPKKTSEPTATDELHEEDYLENSNVDAALISSPITTSPSKEITDRQSSLLDNDKLKIEEALFTTAAESSEEAIEDEVEHMEMSTPSEDRTTIPEEMSTSEEMSTTSEERNTTPVEQSTTPVEINTTPEERNTTSEEINASDERNTIMPVQETITNAADTGTPANIEQSPAYETSTVISLDSPSPPPFPPSPPPPAMAALNIDDT